MTRDTLPEDRSSARPAPSGDGLAPGTWNGKTYFGRQQVKPTLFEPWVVGGYIFLAGLSGSSAILGALATADAARRPRGWRQPGRQRAREELARRSRYLSLLAPTIGSALLIWDLHTPQRFYNMLRIAKARSPMSLGTWILMSFSAFAGVAGVAQIVADRRPRWPWPRRIASTAQIPAAIAGAGLSTYTAALLASTSTPIWAAAPRAMGVRFGSSSIATAASALALGERAPETRRALETLSMAALVVELAATAAADARYKAAGIERGRDGPWGRVEKIGATGLGVLLPIALTLASRSSTRRSGALADAASVASIAGSALMRVSILGVGAESARDPNVSLRFAQPNNLPTH